MARSEDRYLTARQAAAALGISLATLYSYVSRGMLHSERVAGNPRLRRYLREDVVRLVERKEFRRNPAKAAEKGLHWGGPVLSSALTLIDGGRFFYRGVDATAVAETCSVEETAALLWTGDPQRAVELFPARPLPLPRPVTRFFGQARSAGPVERCQLLLSLVANDFLAYDLRPEAAARNGARILRLVFSAVARSPSTSPLEGALLRAWMPGRKRAARALRAALILCADHELNVSAFTARSIASARATLDQVVIGALAALRGRRHGGVSEEVEILFREAAKTRDCRTLLAERLRCSGHLPGFGHPLYPHGDPRARQLLALAEQYGRADEVELAKRLIRATERLAGEPPNLDFGLATFARALALPSEAPIAIFALGRTVGWIAHAIEQYADPRLIRPRARYIGPLPPPARST